MKCTFELNSKGFLKQRESYDLEFKQSFNFGDALAEYLRSIIGMANNKGGEIIFGIQDSPRQPIGLKNDKFDECDPNKINQFISEYFSHEVDWGMETRDIHGRIFGQFWVEEANQKPIVCTRNFKNILKEAAIYYRYRGETREIRYPELSKILAIEREKEKLLWISHIEKISKVGPQNIHLIDTYKGEIETGKGKILLDKTIADRLKFIKEGQFVEKDGAPTLKVVGEVTGIVDKTKVPKTDTLYPYRFTDFKEKFGINSFQWRAILWKLNIKGNSRYHTEISVSKSNKIHKYSRDFESRLDSIINRYSDWIDKITEEYKRKGR